MIVHAIIYAWPRVQARAREIASALVGHADRVSIVDSADAPMAAVEGVDIAPLGGDAYFGAQFAKTIELFQGDVLLQIAADADGDWPAVVERCRRRFATRPNLGVWAPDIDGTFWRNEIVTLFSTDDPGLLGVVQTDCIVWAMRAEIVAYLRRLDFSGNRLGWGADWAAIAHAYASRWQVLRDMTITVRHQMGSNYDYEEASEQFYAFIKTIGEAEQVQYLLLRSYHMAKTAAANAAP